MIEAVTFVPPGHRSRDSAHGHGERGTTLGQHGDRVRNALLDAAEELYATDGIDAVSNRRIAEHSGNANHSAVSYHFGGRDELVRALLDRHTEYARARRAELVAELGDDAPITGLLACLILPFTDLLAARPAPSWRARFLQQLRTVPSVAASVAESVTADPLTDHLIHRIRAHFSAVPEPIFNGRSWMLGRTVIDACAEYESRVQVEPTPADWTGLGYFLIDACAGMLGAPVTHPGDFLGESKVTYLL
ncbi:helix-turn-helix domain-containing protein [Rhodococcus sp. TAF43]|uniref:TetR/AcrR family transcriptional regulator n=1 Tax=unclassified Rhodococcus (in: high G+C Gram-positive bacteria) TaxID=192944 RepID=UPI000E2D4967|nr:MULTISPECIES: helix-turn-helix domain-containing protein [unclassified Rhodococcus (in: high G+C Gram-positive bacteria)]RDI35945.1 TetR family transcriptional regulator [Rhodococcus sp. AG1013]